MGTTAWPERRFCASNDDTIMTIIATEQKSDFMVKSFLFLVDD
jgi:hypothetical protein